LSFIIINCHYNKDILVYRDSYQFFQHNIKTFLDKDQFNQIVTFKSLKYIKLPRKLFKEKHKKFNYNKNMTTFRMKIFQKKLLNVIIHNKNKIQNRIGILK